MPALAAITSKTKNARNKVVRLADVMAYGIDSRIQGVTASATTMPLFTGIGARYTGSTYTPNTNLWCNDLREQLTGIHMSAGGYLQSYGLLYLGGHYVLGVAHNGPEPLPLATKYVKADGTVHTATITHLINDGWGAYPDLSVSVFSAVPPAWVTACPIIQLSAYEKSILEKLKTPSLSVSQGNWITGATTPYGLVQTPNNRMAWVKSVGLSYPLPGNRNNFRHAEDQGDSGTPEYLLINGTLYFYRTTTYSTGSGAFVGDNIAYINDMIARAATASGKPPITVSTITNPIP